MVFPSSFTPIVKDEGRIQFARYGNRDVFVGWDWFLELFFITIVKVLALLVPLKNEDGTIHSCI